MKQKLRIEREKFRVMNFSEKRWYVWEYYKFHIGGFILAAFLIGSFIHAQLNPRPDDYLYVAWLGVPATIWQLGGLAEGLNSIVEDPETQRVLITNYTLAEDHRTNVALQTRFISFLQIGKIDVLITTRAEVEVATAEGIIRPTDEVTYYLASRNVEFEERLFAVPEDPYDPEAASQFMAISLTGTSFLEEYGINTSDVYLAVIVNTQNFYAISRALEMLLYGA